MMPCTKAALRFLLLCNMAMPVLWAQEKPAPDASAANRHEHPAAAHLLDPGDGLDILAAALDARHAATFPRDCSHLVHTIYESAGFSYAYASSSELYAGTGDFRRVSRPQPGDLAVWRGHVGIVVNPSRHSFFSVLRSGPQIEFYDAQYWKKRGQPRFLRYLRSSPRTDAPPAIRTVSRKPAARP
jgi:cell wall-associated NlpC family hydrolase